MAESFYTKYNKPDMVFTEDKVSELERLINESKPEDVLCQIIRVRALKEGGRLSYVGVVSVEEVRVYSEADFENARRIQPANPDDTGIFELVGGRISKVAYLDTWVVDGAVVRVYLEEGDMLYLDENLPFEVETFSPDNN